MAADLTAHTGLLPSHRRVESGGNNSEMYDTLIVQSMKSWVLWASWQKGLREVEDVVRVSDDPIRG